MRLFDPQNAHQSAEHRKAYAALSALVALVNFLAAVLFIIGSILFFNPASATTGTWMFLVGSIFFAVSPTLTLIREVTVAGPTVSRLGSRRRRA